MSEHNCHECGHQHDCDDMDNIIELTGENGETIKVEFLATVKVDEKEYAVMHSLEESDDEAGEVIIMRMEKDGDEDYLESIEDEDELDRVFEAFKQSAIDEYDFEEDEDFDQDEDSEDDDLE